MKKFTLNRNYTHRSVNGVISFVKGEPVAVPYELHKEVIAIGAELVEGDDVKLLEDEKPPVVELTAFEREEALFSAFDLIVERNATTDFTGAGSPTVKAVEKIVEFDVERPEIDAAWAAWKIAQSEE